MSVESAADRLAFLDPDDFGEEISWTVGGTMVTMPVLPSAGTLRLEGIDTPGTIGGEATVLCRGADIPAGAAHGDSVSFWSAAHTVKSIEPDGTGMTVVRLEREVAD